MWPRAPRLGRRDTATIATSARTSSGSARWVNVSPMHTIVSTGSGTWARRPPHEPFHVADPEKLRQELAGPD